MATSRSTMKKKTTKGAFGKCKHQNSWTLTKKVLDERKKVLASLSPTPKEEKIKVVEAPQEKPTLMTKLKALLGRKEKKANG